MFKTVLALACREYVTQRKRKICHKRFPQTRLEPGTSKTSFQRLVDRCVISCGRS